MATYKKRFNFFIDAEDEEILTQLAEEQGISKGEIVRTLLRKEQTALNEFQKAMRLYNMCKEVILNEA